MTYEDFVEKFDLFNENNAFLEESKSILEDYIYSNRACYFIMLSPIEEDALLFYTGATLSRKELSDLAERITQIYDTYFDEDSMLFLSKMIKESYSFADGLFLNYEDYVSLKKQKKIYIRMDKGQELVNIEASKNLYDFDYVLLGRKILFVTCEDNNIEYKNVDRIYVDIKEIKNYNSWLEFFDHIKMMVMVKDFDVALINFGIFTMPLCYFVSQNIHHIALDYRRKLDV